MKVKIVLTMYFFVFFCFFIPTYFCIFVPVKNGRKCDSGAKKWQKQEIGCKSIKNKV